MPPLTLLLRPWRRSPLTAALAVASLALGAAMVTIIASVYVAMRWGPLPYANGARAYQVELAAGRDQRNPIDYLNARHILALRDALPASVTLLTESPGYVHFATDGAEGQIGLHAVSWSYFQVLGLTAARGRVFSPADSADGNANIVAVTDRFWHTSLGSREDAVGSIVRIDGTPFTVVGILPARLTEKYDTHELWTPPPMTCDPAAAKSKCIWSAVIAGVGPSDAPRVRAALDRAAAALARAHPATDARTRLSLVRLRDVLLRPTVGRLMPFASAVATGLFCVAGMNFTLLVLLAMVSRAREFAIRSTLGASPGRVARRVIAEGELLVAIALAVSLVAGTWAMNGLHLMDLSFLPAWFTPRVDWRVGGLVALACMVVGVLLSLPPAFILRHGTLQGALKSGEGGASIGRATTKRIGALVFGELVFTALFLPLATLTGLQLYRVSQVDTGFDHRNVVEVTLEGHVIPGTSGDRQPVPAGLDQVAQGLPGVEASSTGLISLWWKPGAIRAEGPATRTLPMQDAQLAWDSGTLFATLRVPLVAGRFPTAIETRDRAPVALLSRAAALALFGGDDAIGRKVVVDSLAGGARSLTVIGVVPDVKTELLSVTEHPATVFTLLPSPYASQEGHLYLRVPSATPAALEQIGNALRAREPSLEIWNLRTLDSGFQAQLSEVRGVFAVGASICALFAAFSLVGVYGAAGFVTRLRTREIGIRRALGAESAGLTFELFRSLGTRALVATAVGLPLGVLAAASTLHGAGSEFAAHPLFAVLAATAVLVVAVVGAAVPVARGLAIAPAEALRSE